MKRFIMILALAAMGSTAAHAEQFKGVYLSASLGHTTIQDSGFTDSSLANVGLPTSGEFELDRAISFAGALGTRLTPHFMAEVEVSYRNADIDTASLDGIGDLEDFGLSVGGEMKTWALLVNGYYDVLPDQQISPYVSLGGGFARHSGELTIDNVSADESDTVFAYQVGAGVNIDLGSGVGLFGGYRYFGSADPSFDTLDAEYQAHEIRVGMRHTF